MEDFLAINKKLWNAKTDIHVESEFYDLEAFKKGKSSLIGPEVDILGDINNKSILHLQCHFGQDTLSLSRMGANAVGLDISDKAIAVAKNLNAELGLDANFVCCDVYSAREHIQEKFDVVFTSYGTIGWLPDLNKWAEVISNSLKDGGKLVFVEFHPMIWMYDNDFKEIAYSYFNDGPIVEETEGTYADRDSSIKLKEIGWNHNLAEVFAALIKHDLIIEEFKEYDYSPYSCFDNLTKIAENKYQISGMESKFPMMYSLVARKLK